MINVNQLLDQQVPNLARFPTVKKSSVSILRRLIQEDLINTFIKNHEHLNATEFLNKVMHLLGLSYTVDNWQLENIPTDGRVIIVANHPLGSLDGIALLKMVSKVRKDVKIVTNELLTHLDPLAPFFLPVNNMGGVTSKEQYHAIEKELEEESAVIFFPAGEVSRFQASGIKDSHWRSGFLRLAVKTQSPILPIHVGGKNSKFFYGLSLVSKPMSMLLLIKEMFRRSKFSVPFTIGEIIPFKTIKGLPPNKKISAQLFRKHVYSLANDKKPVLETEHPIAHPQPRAVLKKQVEACECLRVTNDYKEVRLLINTEDSVILSEIGRLREQSFRAVGEGTGNRIDIDEFDNTYDHIFLWDPKELEIVGAYRVKQTACATVSDIYSATLFDYQKDFFSIKALGLELGRSFVQPKYWGKRSLEYLWYGIGAYVTKFPYLRYLFGPVSISADFDKNLIDWLAFYYHCYYPAKHRYAIPKNPFVISDRNRELLGEVFKQQDKLSAFKLLKQQLKMHHKTVPTMFKQYSELCESGGVSFSAFNSDPNFNNCVDALVVVDIHQLLDKKRDKFLPNWTVPC